MFCIYFLRSVDIQVVYVMQFRDSWFVNKHCFLFGIQCNNHSMDHSRDLFFLGDNLENCGLIVS